MSTSAMLDLEAGSISSFYAQLQENPRLAQELPTAILNVKAWNDVSGSRVEGVSKAAVRACFRKENFKAADAVLKALRASAYLLDDRVPDLAPKISLCAALVEDMLAEVRDFPSEIISSKKSVRPMLDALLDAGELSKAELMERFSLKDANATRILSAMASARLIEREMDGRTLRVRPSDYALQTYGPEGKRSALASPAITRTTGKRIKLKACTHTNPATFALTYAREIGLTDAFQIDLEGLPLEIQKNPISELSAAYQEGSDIDGYKVVAHACRASELPLKLQAETMDLFVLGTYVGSDILASKDSVPVQGPSASDRVSSLAKFLSAKESITFRTIEGDRSSEILSRTFCKVGIGGAAFKSIKSPLGSVAWSKPIKDGYIELTSVPGFDEMLTQQSNRTVVCTFLDIENARANAIPKGASKKSKKLVELMNSIDLSQMADHWFVSASLNREKWRSGHAASQDVATRLYRFSSVLSELLQDRKKDLADHILHNLRAHISKGVGSAAYSVESIHNDLEKFLRISPNEFYLVSQAVSGGAEYYWPVKEHQVVGPSCVVEVHTQIQRTEHKHYVDHLISTLPNGISQKFS